MPYITLQFTLFVALYFCNFGALSRGKTRMGRLMLTHAMMSRFIFLLASENER